MPLCAKCSNPFVCRCDEQPKKLGSEAEDCPVKKKDGAVWVHVVDDRGIDVNGVDTKKDADGKKTDRGGTAVFDPVSTGEHTVDLPPLTDLLEFYEEITTPTLRTVSVVPGQIAYVPYQLARKPVLTVLVLQKTPRKLFGGASITVDGKANRAWDTSDVTGVGDVGRVTAGQHGIKVKLAPKDAEAFATKLDFAKATESVTLSTGEEREVVVEVEAINVVTPQVDMPKRLLIIDHWPETREAPAECVKLAVNQTNTAHGYAKSIVFKCASTTDVEAFLDDACSESKKLGGNLNKGIALAQQEQDELCKGNTVSVYLRGNTKAGKLAISLELEDPADRFVKLGEKPAPVDAEIELLARPHVNIEWADGGGVEGVTVALDPEGANLAIPNSIASGLAKWAKRGIKPGLYNCALTFPGNVKYLLFDSEDKPVEKPSFDLKPGSESVTYKVKKVKVKLAVTCDGVADPVEAKVKLKSVDPVVIVKKGTGPVPVDIPVTQVDQKCEIETFTLDGATVYEMVEVETT